MKAESIKGMAVVSINEGAKLGYIDDLIFDAKDLRIAAFRVSADKQHAMIPFEQINNVGSDAVTVPSNDVTQWVKPESAFAGLTTLDQVKKLKVVNEKGTLFGTVSGLEVDPRSGRITEVQAHKGGVLGIGGSTIPVAASAVTSVGDEVMVVSAPDPASE